MELILNQQENQIAVRLLPSNQISVTIPNYEGNDPCNRRNQTGVLEYIEFDITNWDCEFKIVFNEPDKSNDYSAYFNFLIFATNLDDYRIKKLKEFIDDILLKLSDMFDNPLNEVSQIELENLFNDITLRIGAQNA